MGISFSKVGSFFKSPWFRSSLIGSLSGGGLGALTAKVVYSSIGSAAAIVGDVTSWMFVKIGLYIGLPAGLVIGVVVTGLTLASCNRKDSTTEIGVTGLTEVSDLPVGEELSKQEMPE